MTPPEPLAVGLTILSNLLLWRAVRTDASTPVPKQVVACHVGSSVCWGVHGALTRDPYVVLAAVVNGGVQVWSLILLRRARVKASTSDTTLPCLPPSASPSHAVAAGYRS